MNIDWTELNKGFSEELAKTAKWDGYIPAWDSSKDTGITKGFKGLVNFFTAVPRFGWNIGSAGLQNAEAITGLVGAGADAVASMPALVGRGLTGAHNLYKKMPQLVDTVGKFAPLAMGALMLPSIMGRNNQQAATDGRPVIVNNYLGAHKPSLISPMQGVNSLTSAAPYSSAYNSLTKMSELSQKKADIISEALATAAKRRMANKVLDVVSPEFAESDKEKPSKPEELEITTKYPEIAKLLQDEENKAYLDRLLQG